VRAEARTNMLEVSIFCLLNSVFCFFPPNFIVELAARKTYKMSA